LAVKNTGTTDATINLILINGKPAQDYTRVKAYDATGAKLQLDYVNNQVRMESTASLKLFLPSPTFKAGQSVEIILHTAAGKDYPKNVVLP
jgi:NAD(P)H-flavin reductase